MPFLPSSPPNDPPAPRRAAFLVLPHAGGVYTVFANLRTALVPHNITLEWIGHTDNPDRLRNDASFAHEITHGTLIDTREKSPDQICGETVAAIRNGKYDLVFVNVLTSPSEMSAAAYLPPEILRIIIVHSISPSTYAAAKIVFPYVHAAVGVSPRIQNDLVDKMHLPTEYVFSVPNAIDFGPYDQVQRVARGEIFRLLYLGRISDMDKGVFFLPEIMRKLGDVPVHLTIAGDGPDLPALKKRVTTADSRITFAGRIEAAEIPSLTARHDALIMPSRFEGFGYSLVEAMASGCVPVASAIRGATDFVLKNNVTGLLFPVGDTAAAARAVRRVATDDALWQRLSSTGMEDVRRRFSVGALSQNYRAILDTLGSPRPLPQLRSNHVPAILHFGGSWRRWIPLRLKNMIRARLTR